MIVFWVVVAIMIVGALFLLLPPLLGRGKSAASATRSEVNLSVYRDQLSELDADLATGMASSNLPATSNTALSGW